MADTKVTDLTPFTPILTDVVYGVDDPGGTPISGKFTLQNLLTLFEANINITEAQISDLGAYITASSTNTLTNKTINTASNTITIVEADISDLGAYLLNVVEDTTPQLGGDLDAQGFNITDLGNVTFQTGVSGGTLRTGTSAADKFVLQAYDVNDTTYRTVIELDAGNVPVLQLRANYLEIDDDTDTTKRVLWDISGATTGTATTLDFNQTAARTVTFPDASGTVMFNVVEDTTPQLGGSLDVNGQKIVSVSNGNIDIEPNGTGNVSIGNFTFDADQTVGAGQDNYVLTYDNGTGLISLEAAAGGGGTPGGSSGQIQYNNASSFDGSYLWQGTNVIEQRNSTNAQAFRVYNTYTDASNYERFEIKANSNIFYLESTAAGTGTVREAQLKVGSTTVRATSNAWSLTTGAADIRGDNGRIYSSSQAAYLGVANGGFRAFYIAPQSSDPPAPSNGQTLMFTGTGAGTGADGDTVFRSKTSAGTDSYHILPHIGAVTAYVAQSSGTTGGTGSAGAGNQYIELNINGTTYKVLHDGTV